MNQLQRSDDWMAKRCGKVTSSRIKDINAKPKKGKALNTTALTILSERLTGVVEENPVSPAMLWGINNEDNAITAYENITGNFVVGSGFVDHPSIKNAGASPDGLIGDDGLTEVKCPNTTTHVNTLITKEVPSEYLPQISWQLACTERKWCDFVSYDPRLEPHLQLVIIRVKAKDLNISELEKSVVDFNKMIDGKVMELQKFKQVA